MFGGLRGRLILVAVIASCGAALAIEGVNYLQIRKLEHAAAFGRLSDEVHNYATHIAAKFDAMENDLQVVGSTPPIQGLIRAESGLDSVDPMDGSTDSQWRKRLAKIFEAVMVLRPAYTQIRYIQLANNGLELVRVQKVDNRIEVVPRASLQEKGGEPYMALATLVRPGEIGVSHVTLNREWGKVDGPGTPTLRMVLPVFAETGERFGAIVINVDYERFLQEVAKEIRVPSGTIVIASSGGAYVTFDKATKSAALMFPGSQNWTAPDLPPGILGGDEGAFTRVAGELVVSRQSIVLPGADGPWRLDVVALVPRARLFSDANRVLRTNILVMLAILAMSITLGVWTSARLTRPLSQLRKQIASGAARQKPMMLTVAGDNEIAELTRAFRDLGNDLIRTSRRAQAVYDRAADGIILVNASGTIVGVNPAAASMFGRSEESLTGSQIESVIPRGSPIMAAGGALATEARRDNGEFFPVEVSFASLENDGETAFVGIIRDISERKAADDKLQHALAELERSNSELDKFAYVASHDLKAPLRVIDNASHWLEEDLSPHLTDDTRETLELLRGRVRRMERLLEDLLAYSRIGRETRARRVVDGKELMDDVLALAGAPESFEITLDGDFAAARLQLMPLKNVLLNLVVNALKHHDRAEGRICVSLSEEADGYVFAVSDDGPGIPAEYQTKIFEMFQTLRPRDEVEGSGMGLAMVQKYVTLQGRTITVESDGIRGTTFRFGWPKDEGTTRTQGLAA